MSTPLTVLPENDISRLQRFIESLWLQRFIVTAIIINAITLGLETSATVVAMAGPLLFAIDHVVLGIFVVEIGIKLWVYRWRFFTNGWNIFDFVIVGVSLLPNAGNMSVLRTLRVLRVLRLVSVVPQMRVVIRALFSALPGMGTIILLLLLVFYVAAVMATNLFGADFAEWFGSLDRSMYTLFQIMTLESWSMGIVRPVMETHPHAWLFFVPFIVVTSFAVLNLFIALIVNSLQTLHDAEVQEHEAQVRAAAHQESEAVIHELATLRQEITQLRQALQDSRKVSE